MSKEEINSDQSIKEKDINAIIAKHGYESDTVVQSYSVNNVSDKMIGFGGDYFKLNVSVTIKDEQKQLFFFVKAVSKTNAAKAFMAKEMGVLENERVFHDNIKRKMAIPGFQPWSPRFVTSLENALVFEDLSALKYEMRSRHVKFDKQHTLQAIQTLTRFHANTIIYEEIKTKELQRTYSINDDFKQTLGKGGFNENDLWFNQCRIGALEAIRTFSKHRHNAIAMGIIEKRWDVVFNAALSLADASVDRRNVICHRDLWSNNIMFHYKELEHSFEPDDCVFVDFAGSRYMPLAGDVMQLLHCNLTPRYRKRNLNVFLKYYYNELKVTLDKYNIAIEEIITRENFMTSAKEQNLWGLVSHICLMQTFCLDDEVMKSIASDSAKFNDVMLNDKTTFLKNMMNSDDDYKTVLMEVLDEFVEDYLLIDYTHEQRN